MGSTLTILIRIRNLTASDVCSVVVYDVGGIDFGPLRPDKVFVGNRIPINACLEKSVELSVMLKKKCSFTMKLDYENGNEDVFRMNYKGFFEEKEYDLRYLIRTHQFKFHKAGPRVLEILIENTDRQLSNLEAERLITDGCRFMANGRYNQAYVKFTQAKGKANETKTIIKLQEQTTNLKIVKERYQTDQQAKQLNNEGLHLLEELHLQEAFNKFEKALKLSQILETQILIEDNLRILRNYFKSRHDI